MMHLMLQNFGSLVKFSRSITDEQFLLSFLADRTNGRAIATLLRLSSVVVVVLSRRL